MNGDNNRIDAKKIKEYQVKNTFSEYSQKLAEGVKYGEITRSGHCYYLCAKNKICVSTNQFLLPR